MSWTQPAYEAVAHVLAERTGLTFPPNRYGPVEQGIRRAMGRARIADVDQYRALVATSQEALDDLIVDVTVGETYFFREPAQFQFIRREVLPDIRRRRGSEHVIRVWSAACASGEEAYSLAIVFLEEGLAERFHLLATDISRAALAKARLATYREWSLRGEGASIARPYLRRRG
ncbi:MAG TPA: CheR family methyltransferase, partial [Gemmataceae bacterium]|nr:CheR family methyltransferase [Gemmataceae bacterium]